MNLMICRNPFRAILLGRAPKSLLAALVLLPALTPFCARATTVTPPPFEELVNKSEYIVRTVVKSVTCERREGGNGQQLIYTFVEFDVREVIAGTPPQPLVLRMLGGQVEDEVLEVAGAPKFQVGQEDILFVRGNGRQFTPLTAMMHGRYPILKEVATGRAYMARSNRAPLTDVSEVSLPIAEQPVGQAGVQMPVQAAPSAALSPAAFVQRIRSAVNSNYRPGYAK